MIPAKGALLLASTVLEAGGKIITGASQSAALKAEAASAERKADEVLAASTRDAAQRRKEADLVLSRQQAVAAASGGMATDTTVLNLMADTAQEGQYQVATSLYEGKAQRAGLLDQAAIARMQAKQAMLSGFIGAGTTMLNGMSSYSKYRPPKFTGTAIPSYSALRSMSGVA